MLNHLNVLSQARFSVNVLAPNIRLFGRYPYEGYAQVKDGHDTWRYVTKDIWDGNRQKMLCQHLGFMSTENLARSRPLSNGVLIASGDLECYNTNANGTSCCVHLQPSTATGQEKSPYPECKFICF
jgi:hypothetical protein